MEIHIDASQLKGIISRLHGLDIDLRYMTDELADETPNVLVSAIRRYAPVAEGHLLDSINAKKLGRRSWSITTGSGLTRPYDVFQERGYKPHTIRPEWMHTKSGYAPPTKPVFVRKYTPFVAPGTVDTGVWLQNQLERRASGIGRRL